MTREEAVTVLKAFMKNPLFSDEHKAAFNIAIHDIKAHHDWDINNLILINKDNYESLEQEPTTKNDLGVDAVNREAVLDLIADYDLSMGQVVKGIHALPSVTPQEPKTGKWISTETKGVRYAFWCRYKCSLCGGLSDRTNFCPNCGARMVEPQESKENENIN